MTVAPARSRQDGSTMIISLIMLVLLTLFVLSAINSSTVNLRVSSNVQAQDEARAAGQRALEQFVSSYANFYPTPASLPATGYDINNDGVADYSVSVSTAVCKSARRQIPPRSTACANGVKSGVYCWDTLWEVTATASDTKSGATQSVTQGVAITFPPAFVPSTAGC